MAQWAAQYGEFLRSLPSVDADGIYGAVDCEGGEGSLRVMRHGDGAEVALDGARQIALSSAQARELGRFLLEAPWEKDAN